MKAFFILTEPYYQKTATPPYWACPIKFTSSQPISPMPTFKLSFLLCLDRRSGSFPCNLNSAIATGAEQIVYLVILNTVILKYHVKIENCESSHYLTVSIPLRIKYFSQHSVITHSECANTPRRRLNLKAIQNILYFMLLYNLIFLEETEKYTCPMGSFND